MKGDLYTALKNTVVKPKDRNEELEIIDIYQAVGFQTPPCLENSKVGSSGMVFVSVCNNGIIATCLQRMG